MVSVAMEIWASSTLLSDVFTLIVILESDTSIMSPALINVPPVMEILAVPFEVVVVTAAGF